MTLKGREDLGGRSTLLLEVLQRSPDVAPILHGLSTLGRVEPLPGDVQRGQDPGQGEHEDRLADQLEHARTEQRFGLADRFGDRGRVLIRDKRGCIDGWNRFAGNRPDGLGLIRPFLVLVLRGWI